jgi:hypothetical protein
MLIRELRLGRRRAACGSWNERFVANIGCLLAASSR